MNPTCRPDRRAVLPQCRGERDRQLARVVDATQLGIPIPGFSSALSYYDAHRAAARGADQGLRDFFGAHTYGRHRRDREQEVPHALERRPHGSTGVI